jgi:hypothetical protein
MNQKRYLILALLGSLIIASSVYIFLINFFDKTEILVFSRDIEAGDIIADDDISLREIYKNNLPDSYILNPSEIIGKKIYLDRRKGDFITKDMLVKINGNEPYFELGNDEVLLAISFNIEEPITEQIKPGKEISIVSTSNDLLWFNNNMNDYKEDFMEDNSTAFVNYIDENTFHLSESILYVDGYIIIRNLEVLDVKKNNNEQTILTGSTTKPTVNVLIKSKINEAPYITDLTSNKNFKIILERID